mgnify:CR=1 FL=1
MIEKWTKECTAKITVDFGKYFDGGKPRELRCCLLAPHPDHKHYCPSLQITYSGEVHKVLGWSHYVERIKK